MQFSEIENNIILEYPVGSHLYGTNTKDSDQDFSGIFIAPIDYYFGMKDVKEIDFSIASKHENGKNDKNAIDRKFYELKRFIKLAADNNPAIIEQLFVPLEILINSTFRGLAILNHKEIFLHKGLYQRFLGYAYSQKKKMIVKLDNHDKYEHVKKVLEEANPTDTLHHVKNILGKYFDKEHMAVGDIKIPLGVLNKKALSIINKRFSNMSHRKELIRKHGFDTKFGSHLIRLTLEGIELLETGNLVFPLKENKLIIDIKNGKYDLKVLLELFDELENRIKKAKDNSELPKKPDFDRINNLSIDLISSFFDNC